MNFGRPLESVCLKINAGFVTKSGVLKFLVLRQLNRLHNDNQEFTPIIKYEKLDVYTFCYNNDGATLKPVVEYDNTFKTNVGLTVIVDLEFIKKDDSLDPKTTLLVTEVVVGATTTADSKLSKRKSKIVKLNTSRHVFFIVI